MISRSRALVSAPAEWNAWKVARVVGRTIFLLAFPRSFMGGVAVAGGGAMVQSLCFSYVSLPLLWYRFYVVFAFWSFSVEFVAPVVDALRNPTG